MPATKGRPGGAEPEGTGAEQTAAGQAALTAEEKRARGIESRARAAAEEKERRDRLAAKEQKRATEREAARDEAEVAVRTPVLEGSAEDEKRRKADEKRVKKELGIVEPSPRWWAPVMVTLMIFGLLWVVLFYISQGTLPIKSIGNWNILVGFAFVLLGFAMTTRWR